MKRRKPVILNKGDVIKTNPQKGYWGCAIVLDVQEHNDEFQPLCLVAVTDFVSREDFSFELPEITYKVGYGKGDGYPLCGPITEGLGFQTVIAWRKANEKEAFMLDVEGTRQITENVLRR